MLVLANTFRSEKVLQLVDKRGIWLYQITYLVLAFATAFIFLDFDSSVLFDRYLYMSFIPLSILIAYMKDKKALEIKHYYWIVACFIACNIFQLFAFVYSTIKES